MQSHTEHPISEQETTSDKLKGMIPEVSHGKRNVQQRSATNALARKQ
jgi:hypothetical protein